MAINERPTLSVQLFIVAEHYAIPAFDGQEPALGNELKSLIEKYASDPRYDTIVKALYTTPAAQMARDNLDDPIVVGILANHAEAIERLYGLIPPVRSEHVRTAA